MLESVIAGFFSGLGLIAAIGAQNAFVLRQGLMRAHIGVVVAICALSDAVLVGLGVAGAQLLSGAWAGLQAVLLWGGVAFLFVYGALRFRASLRGHAGLAPLAARPLGRGRAIATCLAFTWLNPHVYLDTVALLGALSAQYAPWHWTFGGGAVAASFVFFATLGYGAGFAAPILMRPRAWVWLEAGIGAVMWLIAASLAFRALGGG